jgi:hypothetical protein
MTASYVNQDGEFSSAIPELGTSEIVPDEDQFWVVDASVSYRLPKRYGIISLIAKNLFDEEFMFQDMNPRNPLIFPDRLIVFRFTLSF